jgi:hypothetical protein
LNVSLHIPLCSSKQQLEPLNKTGAIFIAGGMITNASNIVKYKYITAYIFKTVYVVLQYINIYNLQSNTTGL